MTLKDIAKGLEGDAAFSHGNFLKSGRSMSYRRTLRALMDEGYVHRMRTRRGREMVYLITDLGFERAVMICDEVKEFIMEWAPLVDTFVAT